MRNLSVLCRKIHRYLTAPFVVLTLLVMVFTRNMPVNEMFFRWQRIFMLGLAITGVYMFIYPYIVKFIKRKKYNKKPK